MKPRGMAASAAALIFGVAICAADASAAVVYEDSFEKSPKGRKALAGEVVKTPYGEGIRGRRGGDAQESFVGAIIDLNEAGIHRQGGMPQGSISLWIQRDEQINWENLLAFSDAKFDNLGTVAVYWRGFYEDGGIELKIDAASHPLWYREDPQNGPTARTNLFPFGQEVAKSQWMNLTLTWGTSPEQCSILVNGRKLPALVDEGFAMARLLADATYIVVGSEPRSESIHGGKPKIENGVLVPGMVDMVAHSVIDAFRITDEVVGEFPSVFADAAGLAVSGISEDSKTVAGFSGKLVAGDVMTVTMTGTPGATGSFDIVHFPDVGAKIDVDWRGWGLYRDSKKVFFEPGEVNLREVEGYEVYAALAPFDFSAPGMDPLAKLKVEEQFYTIETPEVDKPYYVAVVALMRDGSRRPVIKPILNRPLAETKPGVYTGTHSVRWDERYPRAVAVGRLAMGETTASFVGAKTFAIDPSLVVSVTTDPSELAADEKSKANISVVVTDANGKPVSGHEVKFSLFTTSQYTGVVGGGSFVEQVGGAVQEAAFGKTDLFGRVGATYVAGFAAKTAIIVARDMLSNSTGSAWVKSYITASAQLELEPPKSAVADEGFAITVTSSDSWLTADGRSQARITARVTLGGQPVEGNKIGFAIAPNNGSIRAVKDTTDKNGEARALYTAGRKIGMVLITATDMTVGISGSVRIELRSDAPARIKIRIDPDKLPADGNSTADLFVTVTDINDNPNDNTQVEYLLSSGSGRLQNDTGMTDRRGESRTRYTAGRTPGTVKFSITVRSTVPTAEELAKAGQMALAVTDYKFF